MGEGELRRMQELPTETGERHAVDRIAGDRQFDRREVHADLVHPTRLEPHAKQRVPGEQPLDLELRDCVTCGIRVERDPRRVAAVAADRRLDPSRPRARASVHERDVRPLERAVTHELLQPCMCFLRARDHHQPRRVAVEPVHDPGPLRVAPRDLPGQRMDKRPLRMAVTRVHDEARRLVDDEQMLVLPGDCGLRRRCDLGDGGRRRHLDLLAAREPVALRARDPVYERPRFDGPLRGRARAKARGEEPVQALAGRFGRHLQLVHRAATSSVRRGGRGERSAATSAVRRIATPTTMKLSARLNAGHHLRSMKSVTWWSRTRSTRFERLPPISRPSAAGSTGWREPDRAKKRSIQATAMPVITVTTAVALENRPNAIPEFWTWWIESGPTTCTDSSSPRVLVTTCFVTWSAITAATATAPSPAHCHAPAASDRSATETGCSLTSS